MEQTGIVIRTEGSIAFVRIRPGCGGGCQGCAAGHLFTPPAGEEYEMEADNGFGARPGQMVRIELAGGASLAAYGLAYGLPIIGLVAGAAAGAFAAKRAALPEDAVTVACALAGTAAGMALGVMRGRRFSAKPAITAIVSCDQVKKEM